MDHENRLAIYGLFHDRLTSPFCSMELITRQLALLDPITFLYATERRLRSSIDSSSGREANTFMLSTISSNLGFVNCK